MLTISTVGMMIREKPVRPRKKGKKATLRNLEMERKKHVRIDVKNGIT